MRVATFGGFVESGIGPAVGQGAVDPSRRYFNRTCSLSRRSMWRLAPFLGPNLFSAQTSSPPRIGPVPEPPNASSTDAPTVDSRVRGAAYLIKQPANGLLGAVLRVSAILQACGWNGLLWDAKTTYGGSVTA
jgi:hypothetical protein